MENITDKESIVSLNNLIVNVRNKQLIAILRSSLFCYIIVKVKYVFFFNSTKTMKAMELSTTLELKFQLSPKTEGFLIYAILKGIQERVVCVGRQHA
jgi:hypothetical protein